MSYPDRGKCLAYCLAHSTHPMESHNDNAFLISLPQLTWASSWAPEEGACLNTPEHSPVIFHEFLRPLGSSVRNILQKSVPVQTPPNRLAVAAVSFQAGQRALHRDWCGSPHIPHLSFTQESGLVSVEGPELWLVHLPNPNQGFQTRRRSFWSLLLLHEHGNSELQMMAENVNVGCQKKETLFKRYPPRPLPFLGS